MQLTPHFSLAELTRTSTGIANQPSPPELANLKRLCVEILEPIRERTGPLEVTSGFRSPAVNMAIKGSRTSAHMRGLAADVVPTRIALDEAFNVIRTMMSAAQVPVDQLIIYVRPPGKGWLHVGAGTVPRGRVLVCLPDGSYQPWSTYRGGLYQAEEG